MLYAVPDVTRRVGEDGLGGVGLTTLDYGAWARFWPLAE
jgi:hypothetical protein